MPAGQLGCKPHILSLFPDGNGQKFIRYDDFHRVVGFIDDHPGYFSRGQRIAYEFTVVELTRLLQLHRGYEMMNAGDLAVEEGNLRGADFFYGEAERILAGNLEARYWHAVALVNAGQVDSALPIFAKLFYAGENWRELTPRLMTAGFLDVDLATLERIMTVIPPQQ